ncbi:hypothetical protein Tco_0294685 [Tanacetum coccineum]
MVLSSSTRAVSARLSTFLLHAKFTEEVYVDDIIFRSTKKAWCDEFKVLMKGEFEMSAMVKKIFKYLKGQPKLGLWYPRDSPFVLEAYSGSDYAGSNGDRKSTTGGC